MVEIDDKQLIRKRAEALLRTKKRVLPQALHGFSLEEIQKIVHELEVHQIELEIQNEELQNIQLELEAEKKRYFDLYNMAPLGYCTLSEDGFIEEANLELSKLLGVSQEELIKHPFTNLIFREDQDVFYMYGKKFFTSQEKPVCELRMLNKQAEPFWVRLSASSYRNKHKSHVFCLIIADISEHKKFEEKLELSASVFNNTSEAIMITDLEGTINEVNNAFVHITGYSKEEAIGKNPRLLSSGSQSQEFHSTMWSTLIDKGSWSGEIWNKRKNGKVYPEMLVVNTVYDYHGDPKHYVALFSDITEIKEYENSLKNIAHYDMLTQLPNRVLLADRLHQGIAMTQRNEHNLAVIFLDLDGFKNINDTYGHEAGDELLKKLSKKMKKALRKGDTLARIGGDEFVAVLFDLHSTEASLPIIERLLEFAASKVVINDTSMQVTASLGVTFYPQSEEADGDKLLRQADQAMYEAKLKGKNRYCIFNAQQKINL